MRRIKIKKMRLTIVDPLPLSIKKNNKNLQSLQQSFIVMSYRIENLHRHFTVWMLMKEIVMTPVLGSRERGVREAWRSQGVSESQLTSPGETPQSPGSDQTQWTPTDRLAPFSSSRVSFCEAIAELSTKRSERAGEEVADRDWEWDVRAVWPGN